MLKPAMLAAVSTAALLIAPALPESSAHAHAGARVELLASVQAQPGDDTLKDLGYADPTIPSIDFRGGTFSELLEVIGEQIDLDAINLVLKDDAAEMPVEPIRLRDVKFRSVLKLIVPRIGFFAKEEDDGNVYDYYHNLEVIHPEDADSFSGVRPIHVLTYSKTLVNVPKGPGPAPRSFRLLSIAAISADPDRGPHAVEVFLDLVATIMAVSGQEQPELDFHEPSGMLIARVTKAQDELLTQAHATFLSDERARIESLQSLRFERRSAREQIARASDNIVMAERGLMAAEAELSRTREIFDAGMTPEGQVNDDSMLVERARSKLSGYVRDRDIATELLEEVEAKLERLIPANGDAERR